MKIAVACDHGALTMKDHVVAHLTKKGYEVKDFGTYTPDSCDYADFVAPAARSVAAGVSCCAPPASAFPLPPIKLTASAARCCPTSGAPK